MISFLESVDIFIGLRISRDFYKPWIYISYFKTYDILEPANLRTSSVPFKLVTKFNEESETPPPIVALLVYFQGIYAFH